MARLYGCEWCTANGDLEVEVYEDNPQKYIRCRECDEYEPEDGSIGGYCADCAEYHGLQKCKDCGRAVPKTAAVEERDGVDSTFYCPACARERTRDRMDRLGIERPKVDYL